MQIPLIHVHPVLMGLFFPMIFVWVNVLMESSDNQAFVKLVSITVPLVRVQLLVCHVLILYLFILDSASMLVLPAMPLIIITHVLPAQLWFKVVPIAQKMDNALNATLPKYIFREIASIHAQQAIHTSSISAKLIIRLLFCWSKVWNQTLSLYLSPFLAVLFWLLVACQNFKIAVLI